MKNERESFNPIGISGELDMPRIRHLMKIGLFAGVMVLLGDMLLGYGASDTAVSFGGLLFLTKDWPRKKDSANQAESYMNEEDKNV